MREKLIELIVQTPCVAVSSRIAAGHIADNLIANGITIPVRCEHCEHFKPGDDGIYYCKRDKLKPGKFMKKDDFCSYGERRKP